MKATDNNIQKMTNESPEIQDILRVLGGDTPSNNSLPPVGVDLHITEIVPAKFQPTDEKGNPVGDEKEYVRVSFKEGGSLSYNPFARAVGVKFTGLDTNTERIKAMLLGKHTFKFYSKSTAVGKRGEYSIYAVSPVDFGAA